MTVEKKKAREPRIIVFACKWCGLIGADGAGQRRTPLPSNFRVLPVECAAFVEPDAIIRALASGIDGVAVLGCHLGGCRFNDANHASFKRLELLRELFDATGIGKERLHIGFGIAHEDHQYVEVIRNYFDELASLPPLESWVSQLTVKELNG